MDNLYNKMISVDALLDRRFLDCKALYLYCFNAMPSVTFIGNINGEKAFEAFTKKFAAQIVHVHTYRWFKHKQKKFQFDTTIIIMNNNCIVELDEDYFQILHNNKVDEFVQEAFLCIKPFKQKQRKEPLEINLIVQTSNGLELKEMEIKPTKIDINLFYEDDFKTVDEVIRKRLNQKNDKGIVLLHGLPGTGKTTYLRYLIGKIKKRVLFISPNVACNLTNPDFIDLLVTNPNSVLIIEDAEHIIMDRRSSNSSSVSSLLNISDGLLADFLNVQIVCTFNSSITLVDNALLRKGRLIAKYEFGKLSIEKAQKLSDYKGFKTTITKPMTVAEITNQHEATFETKQVQIIGFRKEAMLN